MDRLDYAGYGDQKQEWIFRKRSIVDGRQVQCAMSWVRGMDDKRLQRYIGSIWATSRSWDRRQELDGIRKSDPA